MVATFAGAREQLEQYAVTNADSTGAATFKFPNVPQSLAWVGNITIPGAPFSSLFVAKVGNTPWGVWTGPLPFGPVLASSGMQLVVTATGLQPGVQYSACWLGVSDLATELGPVMPAPSSASAATFPIAPIISVFNQGGVSFTSQQFQCSNVKGARYVLQNLGATAVFMQLQWSPSSGSITTAQGQTNALGNQIVNGLPVFSTGQSFRNIVVAAGGFAEFTHPHLADFLTVVVQGVTGAAILFNLVVSHVDSDRITWGSILHVNVPDVLLASNQTVNAGAGGNAGPSVDIYAGQCVCSVITPTTATTWSVLIQATGVDGVAINLARLTHATGGVGGCTIPLVVPPAPLSVALLNSGAAGINMQISIVADSWQD